MLDRLDIQPSREWPEDRTISLSEELDTSIFGFDWEGAFRWPLETECTRRRNQGEYVNLKTGELRPLWCGANGCRYCGWVKAARTAKALRGSEPSTFLTLTDLPTGWAKVRETLKVLRRSLTRAGYRFEMAWVIEADQHRPHAHALAHGNVPTAPVLAEHATRAGLGPETDVRPAEPVHSGYLMKMPLAQHTAPHLRANGGRLLHHTRAFFRVEGEPATYTDLVG